MMVVKGNVEPVLKAHEQQDKTKARRRFAERAPKARQELGAGRENWFMAIQGQKGQYCMERVR